MKVPAITLAPNINAPFLILSNDDGTLGLIDIRKEQANITSLIEKTIYTAMDGEHTTICFDEVYEISSRKIMFTAKVKFTENEEVEKYTFWLDPVNILQLN